MKNTMFCVVLLIGFYSTMINAQFFPISDFQKAYFPNSPSLNAPGSDARSRYYGNDLAGYWILCNSKNCGRG